MKIGLCQFRVEPEKEKNLEKAAQLLKAAAEAGAEMAVLPEMFNCPYHQDHFPVYAEEEGGRTTGLLSRIAREERLWVVGGSIPERDREKVYNTCFIYDPGGNRVARHRKLHLFDIDLPGKVTMAESATLTAGEEFTLFTAGTIRVGVAICYDLRFPEYARILSLQGADLMVVPAAFSRVTGPAHWEILLRTRAVDNQFYTAGVSSVPNPSLSYLAYGHSMLVDPWGEIKGALGEEEGVLVGTVDPARLRQIRSELPLLTHRRTDLYQLSSCAPAALPVSST